MPVSYPYSCPTLTRVLPVTRAPTPVDPTPVTTLARPRQPPHSLQTPLYPPRRRIIIIIITTIIIITQQPLHHARIAHLPKRPHALDQRARHAAQLRLPDRRKAHAIKRPRRRRDGAARRENPPGRHQHAERRRRPPHPQRARQARRLAARRVVRVQRVRREAHAQPDEHAARGAREGVEARGVQEGPGGVGHGGGSREDGAGGEDGAELVGASLVGAAQAGEPAGPGGEGAPGPSSSWATVAWTKPEGCWVEVSVMRSRRSIRRGWAVSQPRRQPGAMVLEKVSSRITRPCESMLSELGTRLSRKALPEDFQPGGWGSWLRKWDGRCGPPEGYCRYQYGSSSMMMMSCRQHSA